MEEQPIDNGQHWRDRAEKARFDAKQMHDATAREAMLRIAKGYERLAQLAEERGGSA